MKICAISGKTFQFGNNVSHAVNKTRRKFSANIQKKRIFSNVLGFCSLKVTPKGLKIIENCGGFDAFLASNRPMFGDQACLKQRYILAREKIEKQ